LIGRGHIWWTRLDKVRPAVIVSSDDICDLEFWQIHVAHITSAPWHDEFPASTPIGQHTGLPADPCYVSVLDTQLIDRVQLIDHIGSISLTELTGVESALRGVFGLR